MACWNFRIYSSRTTCQKNSPAKYYAHSLPRKTCRTASSVRILYNCTDRKKFSKFFFLEIYRNHLEKRAGKICHQNCKFCPGKHHVCLAEIAEIKEWFFLGFCASETCRILLLSPSLSLEMKSLQTLALFFFLLSPFSKISLVKVNNRISLPLPKPFLFMVTSSFNPMV